MAPIEALSVHAIHMAHAARNIAIWGVDQQMVMV
jgi:hypothetical protein